VAEKNPWRYKYKAYDGRKTRIRDLSRLGGMAKARQFVMAVYAWSLVPTRKP
jgi:hypothetical protein